MMLGKNVRLGRIADRATGNCVMVPMDHGLTSGPLPGLSDVAETVNRVAEGGATAVVMNKGLIRYGYRGYGKDIGLVMHLSASTDLGACDDKTVVSSVEEAIKYGADAVSVHLNIGADTESEMLAETGRISRECAEWGMPLLVMSYARGPRVSDPFDPDAIARAARAATELGADIIKCNYTGDPDSFREVVRGTVAPVLIAGGPKSGSDEDILKMVYDSMQAGGRGVSMGRNIFQHPDAGRMARAVSDIVLNGYTAEESAEKNLRHPHDR